MSAELPKTFAPKDIEKTWYKTWEEKGYFKPRKGKQDESFCIIMPPPNVTGILHMGHALDATTQDVLTRYKRMKGFESLWLPGMDHAGISTQSVVEKKIFKEEGKTRHDLTREEFLEKTWEWKEHHGGVIQEQQRSLGASCDWNYSTFTMDPEANEAVNEVFVDLYNEGLIYQSDYIVNWDTVLQSAISDAEVEHIEVKGAYYHIQYQVKDSTETLIVATTRPETLLGDTGVAVNPEDDRFKHLIGKTAIVPLCNREVPIVGDEHVDIEKGTGCLKVTPGHDFNDFDIGKRHNLEIISILNKDGTLNDYGLEWKGLSAAKARPKIVEKLDTLGIFLKKEETIHQVGHGDRSKSVIEPLVSKQWFLNTKDMSQEAVLAVENDKTKYFPKGWENTYFSWLRNPKDWCISRQLWWGHKIPVFTCNDCNHQWAAKTEPEQCSKCSSKKITQDPDVLDTWFSSALWPFSTLGWPNKERMELRKFDTFYPSTVLITGFDIIFFWVARMMMMGLKFQKTIPFHHVYIHAIVRDKQGRKMSKSLGNGIDPLTVVDESGADALRFTLASSSGYNRTINLDPAEIEGYRNFINKLWNAFRFIHPFLDSAESELPKSLDQQSKWILSELNTTAKAMNESLDIYRFDDACSAIYQFTYDKFCSWFIELSKPILYGDDEKAKIERATILKFVLKKMMALLHPIAPYISEEIWKYIKDDSEDLLIIADYPEFEKSFDFTKDQEEINLFIQTVTLIRNLRQSINLAPKEEVGIEFFSDDENAKKILDAQGPFFYNLAKVKNFTSKNTKENRPGKSLMGATPFGEIFIPLEGLIDLDAQVAKLKKDMAKAEKEVIQFEKKLANKGFVDRAPEHVIVETKEKLEAHKKTFEALKENLKRFS